jgi:peroxiredoxin
MGLDLEAASGRDHHMIAVPAVFIVDRAGIIRWAHADADYKTRPTPEQLLRAVEQALR